MQAGLIEASVSAERAAPIIETIHRFFYSLFYLDSGHRYREKVIIMSDNSCQKNTPFRINLEQQKKRAKELFKACQSGDTCAIERIKTNHPGFSQKILITSIKLSDAQLIIARELGLSSWAKLKAHTEKMKNYLEQIQSKSSIPDAELTTLHIRCGTDLKEVLPAAGFTGDFLEYSDPLCHGPVSTDANAIEVRAKFVCEAYGTNFDLTQEKALADFNSAELKLTQAKNQYQRIVLWFEHDSYDQLILARILANFYQKGKAKQVDLISINNFPGADRFIGLGQLPPEAIRSLWITRKTVTQAQLALGNSIWQALGEASPEPLYELSISNEINKLPNMAKALQRHLQELPSTENGLSLTEQLILEAINEKELTAGQLFSYLMIEKEPLPWLGDIMFLYILESMQKAEKKPFTLLDKDQNKVWHKQHLIITKTGQQLLKMKIDGLKLNSLERWIGGVQISSETSKCWRWNQQKNRPVFE